MNAVNMLMVDDHDVVRKGLKFILQNQDAIEFEITEAASRIDCLTTIEEAKKPFDIILMDVNLGKESGIELTKELLEKNKSLKMIALTMHDDEFVIRQMLDAGVVGYLLKNTGGEELIRAIQTVMNNEKYFSNRVALTLLNERTEEPHDNTTELLSSLSPREKQILKMIVSEMTNEEIAEELFLSKRTVDGHRQKLITKLGVRNTAGLVKFAVKAGV